MRLKLSISILICVAGVVLAAIACSRTAQRSLSALTNGSDSAKRHRARAAAVQPRFPAKCPHVYQRPTMSELEAGTAKPYVFGQDQRPECTRCKDEDTHWFCRYRPGGHPVCPWEDQKNLTQLFLDMHNRGSQFASGLLTLTPCDLWPYLHNRTTWLVGDSITQEFMRAVECFFMEFGIEREFSDEWQPPANPSVVEGIMKYGEVKPWCIQLDPTTRLCHIRCNMGTVLVSQVLPFLDDLGVKRTDLWVLNFAVWINKGEEYMENVRVFANYVRAHAAELPFIVWREASVQHFETRTGDYNGAAWPFHCQPIGGDPAAVVLHRNGMLSSSEADLQVVVEGGWRNRIANPIIAQLGIPIMHTWNQTVLMHGYHHHYNPKCAYEDRYCGDCTHTCHPSMYQMWIYHMYQTLQQSEEQFWQHLNSPNQLDIPVQAGIKPPR